MYLQNSTWEPWLETLLSDNTWGYLRGYNLYEWILAISLMYFVGIIFFFRAKRSKAQGIESLTWLYRAFGLFMFVHGLTRICFVFAYWIEPYYNFFLALGYAFGACSLLLVVIVLEKYFVQQTKHFFSIVGIILVLASFYFVIFPSASELSRTIQNFGMPVIGFAFVLLYGHVIRITVGTVRKKAIFTLLSMFVFILAVLMDSETALEANTFPLFLPPIILALGTILIGLSQKMEREE